MPQGKADRLISPHAVYNGLGLDSDSRKKAYCLLFVDDLNEADVKVIKNAIKFSEPTGDNRFKAQIDSAIKRKLDKRK